jgi:co-chaperonin GroES (HSP10)
MKPIGKYILLTPVKEEVKTESGILLSADDVDNIRYKKGIVNASGTDVNNIEANDTIYYDSRAGYSMMIKDILYTVITERDVVVVE